MRIAIVHHQLQPKGGMETYLLNLIEEFHQQQDDLTAYIYKPVDFVAPCKFHRVKLNYLPRSWRKFYFGYLIYKQKEFSQFDLTITLMRAINQHIIICGGTHQGCLTHTNKVPNFLDRCEIRLEQKSYDSAQIIIAHSQLLKNELINSYKIACDKITTIYPPIDTEKFNHNLRGQREQLRAKYNIDPDKIAVLFPSTGHKRKGLRLLCEAMATLSSQRYQLIITGSQPLKSSYPAKYVGFTTNMAELYHACDITVLPAFYEPFGLVAIESIACGTPVILSQFVGAKELVTAKEGIILTQLTATVLANAIVDLASLQLSIDPEFAHRHGLTVSEHVKKIKKLWQKGNGNEMA